MELSLSILVDISFISFFILGFYQSKKSSFLNELFSIIGIGLAAFLSLHYYVRLGTIVSKQFLVPELSSQLGVYLLLVIGLGFLLSIGFESLSSIFKLEVHPSIDKWGGFLIGLCKVYFVVGLLFLGLYISQEKRVIKAANQSLVHRIFKSVSIEFYRFCFDQIILKMVPFAQKNNKVFEIVL